jgi:hypothetical protein
MVEVALNVVKDESIKGGKLRLQMTDVTVADMKEVWNELKKARNAEFGTLQKQSETVHVAKHGDVVIVKVIKGQKTTVDLRVPVPLVDALLEGSGNELNVRGALLAIRQTNGGDILKVTDHETHFRIWID